MERKGEEEAAKKGKKVGGGGLGFPLAEVVLDRGSGRKKKVESDSWQGTV